MERFTSFDGVGIAYTVVGDGPDALLLHGFASDHRGSWVEPGVVDALVAAGRRVIALDARGHGQSDKPHDPAAYENDAMMRDAQGLLDHLGVESVDVIGYSMGALVSARLVPDEPRARSCVLGGIGRRENRRNPLTPERQARIADALEADASADVSDASARAFRAFADQTGADRQALAAFQRARTAITRSRLGEFRVPTLVIAGDADTLAGSAQLLADRIPGAMAKTIKGTHLGAVMDPEFPRSIVDFVTGVAVAPCSALESIQRVALDVHQWLYEHTDGRIGRKAGKLPALLLRTTGARTGQTRTAALVYGTDGTGRYVVVGSDGGSDRAPGWVHNLRANPSAEVQIGRTRYPATAEILTEGPDFDRCWKIVNDLNRYKDGGRYDHYQTLTTRKIPVVVLST